MKIPIYKTKTNAIIQLHKEGKSKKEIMDWFDSHGISRPVKSTYYEALKKTEVPTLPPMAPETATGISPIAELEAGATPTIEVTEEPVTVPPELTEITTEPGKLPEILAKEEALSNEDLTYVWKSVNELFGKHKRPDKSMELLGKVWVRPCNRLMEKYIDENSDLYLALGVTALTFSPSVISMTKERKEKIEAEKRAKTKSRPSPPD